MMNNKNIFPAKQCHQRPCKSVLDRLHICLPVIDVRAERMSDTERIRLEVSNAIPTYNRSFTEIDVVSLLR